MDKYLGKRLDGRYEMRELIGVGGMAYVYKAYDAVDDRIVAVKILKDEYLNSDEFVRRFRNESKAIAILNHPNIVKVLDVGFGERLQYIVMEYIDGITLKEYLDQRKDIRWKEAVHFTVQILRALQHAHDKGIVHRDIKPQNIMLLSDGTIKVTDFGIARLTRSDMKATVEGNKAIGSVHYISPEQARGEITDEKTDLYAVGIMLYEMLTGCLPFEADNAVSVAIMQMQSEAKAPHLINEEIPEGLEQITLKAMQKDTVKRYQSAAEMLSDFDEFKKNPSIKFEYTYMVDDTPTRYVDAITRVRGESPEQAAKDMKEEPVKQTKKAAKKNNTKTIILIVSLCLVVALFVTLLVILIPKLPDIFKKKADEVVVDKFIGMMYYTDIEGNLEYSQKFDLKIKWEDANNPDIAKNEVYKQEPAAGKTVKKGATVTLYVNTATPKNITLDVRAEIEGVHKNDVRKLLQDSGFVVNELTSSSDTVPADHVISINISKGQSYAYGTKVTMVVSTGKSTLPPIDFPSEIIGESQATATSILKSRGFVVDKISTKYANYTDDTFAAKGVVMGVMVDGVLLEELPEQIAPDASLTLVLSNGLKDVVVELEWPKDEKGKNVNYALNISVVVNGTPKDELVEQYNNPSYNPSYKADKLTFTLTDHPSDGAAYIVGVSVKKDDSSSSYKEYVRISVDPVTGTWTIAEGYNNLPGISAERKAIPADVIGYILSYEDLKAKLSDFNVTVVDAYGALVTSGDSLYVDRIVSNGTGVSGGDKVVVGSQLKVHVSNHSASTDVEIPGDIFSSKLSVNEILNKLSAFSVTVMDADGNVISEGDGLYVTDIRCDGMSVTSGTLPEGAAIEVTTIGGKTRIPDDLDPTGMLSLDVKNRLVDLDFTVEERFEINGEYDAGRVLYMECNGSKIGAGDLVDADATIVICIAAAA